MDKTSQSGPTQSEIAIANTAYRIDKELSVYGWDQAPCLFALVKTAHLLEQDLPEEVARAARADVAQDSQHYTAVLQELSGDLEQVLGSIWWPDNVEGAAISLERIVLPPQAEADVPSDQKEREEFLVNHPDRDDVRIVVAVLRDGPSWCTLRARSQDSDAKVAGGSELVPELVEALRLTFSELEN